MSKLEKGLLTTNIIFLVSVLVIIIYLIMNIQSLRTSVQNKQYGQRYDIVFNESKVIVFDRVTGKYWSKYEPNFSGSTEWVMDDKLITAIKESNN